MNPLDAPDPYAMGRSDERTAIVTWLRDWARELARRGSEASLQEHTISVSADIIEKGGHRKP